MTSDVFPFECQACCSDWRDYKRQVEATPSGAVVPTWPRKDCERPDCRIYDEMLDRLDSADPALASRLRSIRTSMADPGYQRRAREWQKQQEAIEERTRYLDVPLLNDHWDHTIPHEIDEVLASFDEERLAWVRCQQAWRDARAAKQWAIALCGPSRSGKTCAVCRWLQGIAGGRFVTAAKLCNKREAAVSTFDRTELEVLRGAPALVIDDMDRSPLSEADRSRLAEVVRSRESRGLPTALTMIKFKLMPAGLVKRVRPTMVG